MGPAGEVGDPATRLLDDEPAGGEVPRLQLFLPVAVEPAAGEPAEVERRGAFPAYPLGASHPLHEEGDVVLAVLTPVVGEAGRQERLLEARHRRDADGRAV